MTESAYLSHRVMLDDPLGSAGLLSQEQRDGLLLALWLLVAEPPKGAGPPLRCTSRAASGPTNPIRIAGFDIDDRRVRRRTTPSSTPRRGTLSVVSEATTW